MTGFVTVENLGVRYRSAKVLDGLDMAVREGEFVVLLGPSGCGKSTLLNAIAGLIETDDGTVAIGGRDVTFEEPSRRGIAMVFQSYALYPRMTVRENLSFGLRVARRPRAEIAEKVGRAADMLQLTPLLDRRPAELSGGQRQRVAIGRALVRDVSVYLFDEPLSNLDAKLRQELRVEIKRLHQQLGSTMIYVTHDQVEALTLADRIAVMKDGVIQQLGAPDEVYARPANRFVAEFLGAPAMNFWSGRIEPDGQGAVFVRDGQRLSLPPSVVAAGPLAAPREVDLGLRPEDLAPVPAGTAGALTGSITVSEPMGPETTVWLDLMGVSSAMRLFDRSVPVAGQVLHLRPDLARASVFDRATGARL